MTSNAGTIAYNYPDLSATQFGTLSAGMEVMAMVRMDEGWVGFDPGVAQAGNSGLKRMRWVADDERLVLDCLDTLEVVTMAQVQAEVPLESAPLPVNIPANWLRHNSPAGYSFSYPPDLTLEVRAPGFIVLLEDPNNPQAVAFSIDDRWQETLGELKADVPNWAVNVTYTDLAPYGQSGFLVEGEVGPGYGQGLPVYTAYFELGSKRIGLACGVSECDEVVFGVILESFS